MPLPPAWDGWELRANGELVSPARVRYLPSQMESLDYALGLAESRIRGLQDELAWMEARLGLPLVELRQVRDSLWLALRCLLPGRRVEPPFQFALWRSEREALRLGAPADCG